jgi:hypothetical protein
MGCYKRMNAVTNTEGQTTQVSTNVQVICGNSYSKVNEETIYIIPELFCAPRSRVIIWFQFIWSISYVCV